MTDAIRSPITYPPRTFIPASARPVGDGTDLAMPTASASTTNPRDRIRSSDSADEPDSSDSEPEHDSEESNVEPRPSTRDEEPDKDPYQTNPDHYEPWLPRQDNAGILTKLHVPGVLLVFISTFAAGILAVTCLVLATAWDFLSAWNLDRPLIRLVMHFIQVFNVIRGSINWLPAVWMYLTSRRIPEDHQKQRWLVFIVGSLIFVFLAWVNYILPMHADLFQVWGIVNMPQSFRGCDTRVATQQTALFTPGKLTLTDSVDFGSIFPNHVFDRGHYHVQFDRISMIMETSLNWAEHINITLFEGVRRNQTLCEQGFQGDSDYYGIGIRTGLYLQWAASILANNFLPSSRNELQKVYLGFSLAICIATIVTTFTATCTFGIEIEILYWMYWGGYTCVFASAPDGIGLELEKKWLKLDWTTTIMFIKHMAMTYHGIWFVWYGYDQVFARMPCGTYQFLLAPMLDPSDRFSYVRDLLQVLWLPIVPPLLVVFPFLALLLATEIKHSIAEAPVFGLLFHRRGGASTEVTQDSRTNSSLRRRMYAMLRGTYRGLRRVLGLPPYARKGIRLITRVDIKHRRKYRIRCALIGLFTYGLTISAIELTLKWNKVVEINKLAAPGQYISLIIGAGTLISVVWRLVQQESERRRKLKVQQIIHQDIEEIELREQPSSRVAAAIRHAFVQRDVEFLANGGVLPADEQGAQARRRSSDSLVNNNDAYMMSGGLGAADDD